MPTKELDPDALGLGEDWEGNNAAFSCPADKCGKVFIVSAVIHVGPKGAKGERGYRQCPRCGRSVGHVQGGKKDGGRAWIEWPDGNQVATVP
jgi:hypothetical protein